ncbi:ubiquitin carboxyl-terminal hydrolase 8 [Eurytemora carolleeae]|uniref:ubiquitin carboxyl-terminal hydrolase 8 n=1 Tax=Eurytemora carolleeae TaxID=1294199 RepID=UPI000C7911D7|nr:ubiquitin carboxyl-terminal hydrolase 8 [Eurytemora carolleeae]|eukprot:XP_023337927.1 ubiquitin carboxyl-terminal hydrolase 8-like [Eurytemora affinis]
MEGKLKFKSLEDLQSQAKTGDISKFKLKNLCESSSKVWVKAMAEDVRLDEETSYILYWKYVLLCKSICQQADYKSDIKYYEGMYNIKKNMKTAVKRLETLSTSLDLKYEKLSNAETKRRLTDENEELAKTKITDDKRKKNKENIANGELKLNIMSVRELDSLIKQKSTSFFILDTRPEQDYHKGHINHPSSLSVPQEILSRGVTAHAIGRNIRIQERTQWERRATVDKLIICDWNSKEFIPGSPAFTLLTALTDWDRENTYRCAPVLLEGGYEKFRLAHPLQVTDPTFKMPVLQEVDRNKNILRLEDIIFPDLDSLDQGFIETPSPSPKMVPNFEPKSSRVQYPSLDGYTPSTVYSNPSTSTPLIPDRRTKPARSNGQDLDESSSSNAPRDDFNAAR